MPENTGGEDAKNIPFAPLHDYVLAHPCPTCKAVAGTPCDAPRKQAALQRKDKTVRLLGHEPKSHDPLHLLHTRRQDVGARHRDRDIGNAPEEDRVAGRSYSTLGQGPNPGGSRKKQVGWKGMELSTRAAAVLGGSPGAVKWPYGLTPAARSSYKSQDAYEAAVQGRLEAQELLVAWAEEHGLRQSSTGCCPRWLQRSSSRQCRDGACTRQDPPALDAYWLDHTVGWLLGGRPAVLTSAPYHFEHQDQERLRWWTTQDPLLRSARGTGWYGFDTTQIVVWRADLLETVTPLGPVPLTEAPA
ncbi:hypothetical protein [Streptomyces vietnamensis]|uniref:Uncharacterized protein n=1 Tax=Streptomyces vietnamensis TaxID=362257 RepID=A0A0B5IPS0_9ACTN|nr:hypothetical protein [Streptomyces vietnamensis]AJF70424.1 hypothetical protein SVTN_40290 [Streptomyces vietnamensis]